MASKAPSVEDQGALNAKNLSSELSTVSKWYQLGIRLGLQPFQLRQIEQEVPTDIDRRKTEVVDLWLQSTPGASWRHIVTALRELGYLTTAERIELNYVKGTRAESHQEELSKAAVFAIENRQAINGKFAVLLMNVCNKMFKNGVDINTFRLFVVALFPPGRCIPPLPTNLTEIFDAITHHGLWDSLHYSPLVQIARTFGAGDPDMEAWIQKYMKDLKSYNLLTTVEDCIESELVASAEPPPANRAKYDPHYCCPVEWKTDFIVHTLYYLADVWEMFSNHYFYPDRPATALLDRVYRGCISVVWLVPSYLIPQLLKRVQVDTTFFRKHRILKVTVGGEVVYEEEVAGEAAEDQKKAPVTKVTMGHEGGAEMGQRYEKSATPKEAFGGYDCEFVEPPPSVFQTECPICHLILREPYLVSCCGTHFCHTCFQRLQAGNSPCPNCRKDNIEVFPNKGLNRSLKQLQVYCTHRKDCCQWRGELRELDQHMNISNECPLTIYGGDIKMTNYVELRKRNGDWYSPPFYTHRQGYKMCLRVYANGFGDGKGTHVSVFAYLMRGEFDNVLKWPFRGHVVIQLCNQLQDKYHRGYTIDFSKTTDARIISRVISGEKADSGCGFRTFIPHNDLYFNPTTYCKYLRNNCLQFRIVAVESLSEPGVLPTGRTMTCLEQHKIDSDQWYSRPFYTHPQGYKMCLRVDADGDGESKGTHVSVSVYLMRGEFDDVLKWPFRGHVVIQLCNRLRHKYHRGYTIDFSKATDARAISRVTSGERAESGCGYRTFIPHDDLNFNPTTNCQYLKNDCLQFRIVAVESLTEPGVLPAGWTMTCLEQHKIDSDQWYSPPFYTHPQGYKMCLRVDADGDGESKGTHVSVSVYLMRGEFDDVLKWPFRGHVVIQLCNQLQDKYHRGHTIDFSKTTDARIIGRVISGERADSGCGYRTFIPHDDLNFNPTTYCKYLRNDCLQFRIVAVESLSEPGVLPAGRTMTCLEQHKIDSDQWYSRPFYTHPQGYKMCLRVDADGDGESKGTHVSVSVYLMRGEFDDVLKWPFRGHVVIQLCNQLRHKYHRGYTIDFSETTDARIISRVTSGERAKSGCGYRTFIPHNDLNFNPTTNCQYLRNDCLHFQIVAPEPGVLPTGRIMTCLEQHKIDSDQWYSLPFYTHPQGYKMCLRVDANGNGEGKGTHVSVSVYLMRGEFDDILKWPFRGHVVIQLCNQLRDKYHRGLTIDFSETTDPRIISRVTSGERAENGCGSHTFIPHNYLNLRPAFNCQYLINDCLHFQIVVADPGVLPTGRTMTCLEQHKIDSDQWYSRPFYTHPQGYKMCLRVDANGDGKGKGTHVSMSVYLMRGEFDNVLKWPFRGHVVIQLCNQLQDKYHRGYTIDFSKTTDARIISRVICGERAESGCGYRTFIPHNDLNFNPATNCQYLRNDCLHFQIVAAEPGVLPTGWIMTCLEQHKIDSDQWYSRPFYTHPQGYKMCLRVDANGDGKGKGTHVSVSVYLMRGEFDDVLKWPFRGHVVIQLCNQLQDKYHRGYTIDFSETTDARIISRVTSGERTKNGCGYRTFIPHNDLNFNPTTICQYLKNDCLQFRIVAVESLTEPGVLPAGRTMTCLEQHKIDSDQWYSRPFYTHPQGFKMCLRVDADGDGEGKGTHVSVSVYLMRGEFDDVLKWPFRGHVVIQLCNQLQDKYHRGYTIDFSKTTDARIISRVTSGERAESGCGYRTFIPHNDLNFNPTTNCQYLKNDCLHFQIVAVESLSEPGVLPAGRTMTCLEQHKIDSDQWYSLPFYTHPQGYKMCLRVDANGDGGGSVTWVSMSVYLMRGEFDNVLKWPFRGHVVIQLYNQLKDKYHRGYTIDFSETTDARIISRVTSGERADSGCGYRTFIPHNNLNFNPNDCLHFQIVAAESLSEPGVLLAGRTMTRFEQHRIDSDQWYSRPFYAHPQGYKMCLRVDANGDGKGKGTHVSMSVYLMRGEFDNVLKWPFRGHVVIQLCNQLRDKYHRGYTIDFSKTTDARIISRVISGERADSGCGYRTFIPHNNLNFNPTTYCKYLRNDCLQFRIVAVESLSEPGVLPAGRAMTCLEQHKIDSDQWYSRPFYTHPQGYKMCLRVDANGHGKGKGTHVSVSVYLMRGEFDDVLKWPFRGHVVIQLCNQLQDKYHRGYTIDFSKTTDARTTGRVTSGERADSGCGYRTFIPHNNLNFNPTTNCQYLKNDCLHFQIVAVESLSEPEVLPAGRTMTCLEQHKIDSDQWYSRPFYTHPQGYKMCLRVDANGCDIGEGTHVSVSVSLMRGEFDSHLKWPFRGHVTVAMLNQLEDNNHTTETITSTSITNSEAICRVTEREIARSGWGCATFIAHTKLNYNPTKNCQYLKYDCLRFQIV